MYEALSENEVLEVTPGKLLTDKDVDCIRRALEGFPATEVTDCDGTTITVQFYRGVVSRSMVLEALRDAGYEDPSGDSMGPLARRLKRMAESSEATFGPGKLDCCNLRDE